MKKISVAVFMAVFGCLLAQKPALEFSKINGDGNPAESKVVLSQNIYFNLDRSTDDFVVYQHPTKGKLMANFQITNPAYGGINRPPQNFSSYNFGGNALVMGASNNGVDGIFRLQDRGGDTNKLNSNYTSAGHSVGTGFNSTVNYGINFCLFTNGFTTAPAAGVRRQVNDIVITFNRPVNDPVIHFNGLGGKSSNFGFTTEFDVLDANSAPLNSLVKLSGKSNFSVAGNKVINTVTTLGNSGDTNNAASGSVKVSGKGITKLVLRAFVRSDSGSSFTASSWGGTSANVSDGFTIGLSVAESELKLTSSVNNLSPVLGEEIELTFVVNNNGPSDDASVKLSDLLPAGFTFVSSSDVNYNASTDEWSIGNLASGASRTIKIKAKVNTTASVVIKPTLSGVYANSIDNTNALVINGLPVSVCPSGNTQVQLSSHVLSNNISPVSVQLFYDDFGISDINNGDRGRKTSAYMPSGSFQYGSSYLNNGAPESGTYSGTAEKYQKARINDGYYAVVSPGNINNGWYSNDGWASWWKTNITDFSGTANGAAMVINAGNNLNAFYDRSATLQVGAKYKAGFKLFLVPGNSPVRLAIDVRLASTNAVIATVTTDLFPGVSSTDTTNNWKSIDLEFVMPGTADEIGCISKDVIISFRNSNQAIDGNDYYVDDIYVTRIMDAPPCPPASGCLTNGISSVNLNSTFDGVVPAGTQLVWFDTPSPTGTPVADPTYVTSSGTYYAFFYDSVNNCYNTNYSTAYVNAYVFNQCPCIKPGNFTQGGVPTKFGITTREKLANWPESVPNGHIALESGSLGFVITRVSSSSAIAEPKKGMLIYDIADQCTKLYNGSIWKCIERTCND